MPSHDEEKELARQLPPFIHTTSGKKPTPEQLDGIVAAKREAHRNPIFTYVRMNALPAWNNKESEGHEGGFRFTWGAKNVGFGEFVFVNECDGTVSCDREGMSNEFILAAFKHFLENTRGIETRPASEEDRQKIVDAIKSGNVEMKGDVGEVIDPRTQ